MAWTLYILGKNISKSLNNKRKRIKFQLYKNVPPGLREVNFSSFSIYHRLEKKKKMKKKDKRKKEKKTKKKDTIHHNQRGGREDLAVQAPTRN